MIAMEGGFSKTWWSSVGWMGLLLDKVLKCSQMSRKCAAGGNQSLEYPNARNHWWYVLVICVWSLADSVVDLVPVAHLVDGVGEMGQAYLEALRVSSFVVVQVTVVDQSATVANELFEG